MSDQQPRDPWAVPPDPDTSPTQAVPSPDPGTSPTQAFDVPGQPAASFPPPAPLPADPYGTPPASPYGAPTSAYGAPPPAAGAVPPADPYAASPYGGPPPVSGAVPPPYPPAGYPGAGYPPGYAYPAATQTSQNAVVALVLAILSWVICPLIPAIVALFLAASAKREIAASGGRVSGEGLVTAAKVISWLNVGFYLAFGVLMLILLAVGFFAASTVPSITTFPTPTFSLGA